MARSITTLSFAVLLALLEIGSCTKCYQCISQMNPKCGDPFLPNEDLVVDCNSRDTMNFNLYYINHLLPAELITAVPGAPRHCHKIVMKSGTTIRSCLDVNPIKPDTCDALQRSSDPNVRGAFCSVCDKDLCNGAGQELYIPTAQESAP